MRSPIRAPTSSACRKWIPAQTRASTTSSSAWENLAYTRVNAPISGLTSRAQVSEGALKIGEGSLYPALQRLLLDEYVRAEWGLSENNRRARFYRITGAGRKKLAEEKRSFDFLLGAIARVMEAP